MINYAVFLPLRDQLKLLSSAHMLSVPVFGPSKMDPHMFIISALLEEQWKTHASDVHPFLSSERVSFR